MRRILSHRPSPALALCTLALFAALGAVAWAAIPGPEAIIHGCYRKRGGALRVINTADHAKCGHKEAELNWEEIGPRGPRGATGSRGATGPAGATGPRGPSNAYATSQSASLTLSGSAGEILSLTVPAGDYVLDASVKIANEDATGEATEEATCVLKGVPSPPPEASATVPYVSGSTPASETVPLDGAVSLSAPATLELSCMQLTAGPGPTVASQARIEAVQVASLES
jgi:hypothetical protein